MLSWLKFSRKPHRASTPAARPQPKVEIAVVPPHDLRPVGVPVYPPLDGGLAIVEAAGLIASQHELVELLRRHVSLPQAEFERKYLAPIKRLAEFIGLLPASRSKHHSGAGGLFRFALEMGVHSARMADGVIFAANEQFERRRSAEIAWRHAAFLTALCSELYRPLLEMQVVDAQGDVWGPYLAGVNAWAKERSTKQVYIRWVTRESEIPGVRAVSGYALNSIAGDGLLNELHGVSQSIVHAMVGTVTGTMTALDDHPLQRVISTVRSKVIEQDQARAPALYGNLTQGAHLEPFLLDGMRQLLSQGKWKINGKNARLHYGKDGLHLVWPIGAKELLEFLRDSRVDGIPANHVTLGEMFLSSGIVDPAGDGQPWHMVYPSTAESKSAEKVLTVRFKRPRSIIPPELEETQPVDWKLAAGPAEQVVTPQAQATAAPAAPPGTANPMEAKVAEATVDAGVAAPVPDAAPDAVAGSQAPALADAPAGRKKRTRIAPSAPEADVAPAVNISSGGADDEPVAAGGAGQDVGVPHDVHEPASMAAVQASSPGSRGLRPGAIAERQATETDISDFPPEVIAMIGKPLASEIAKWRGAWNSGRSSREFMVVEGGLAVTVSYITSNTVLDNNKIIQPLRDHGLIVMKEDGGRTRPIHKLNFPEKGEDMAFIFKRSFVTKCGFVLN